MTLLKKMTRETNLTPKSVFNNCLDLIPFSLSYPREHVSANPIIAISKCTQNLTTSPYFYHYHSFLLDYCNSSLLIDLLVSTTVPHIANRKVLLKQNSDHATLLKILQGLLLSLRRKSYPWSLRLVPGSLLTSPISLSLGHSTPDILASLLDL